MWISSSRRSRKRSNEETERLYENLEEKAEEWKSLSFGKQKEEVK